MLVAISLCTVLGMRAQQDAVFQQYWATETQFNPAAAGKCDQLNITAALQTHAAGFSDAGSTIFAGVDAAFKLGKTRHGAGVSFQTDNIGLFSHKKIDVQYAYQLQFHKQHRLSIGAAAHLLSENVEISKADIDDTNDPLFTGGDLDGSNIDVSAGLYYQWKDLSIGAAMTHLMAPTIKLGDRNEIKTTQHLYVDAMYRIRTRNPYFHITPSAMLRTDFGDYRADLTARFAFERDKKNLNFGINYAPLHSVAIFLGGVFHGINVCYSYEANTEGMGLGAGQHEVTVGYKLDLKLQKKGRNLHRTVRWL